MFRPAYNLKTGVKSYVFRIDKTDTTIRLRDNTASRLSPRVFTQYGKVPVGNPFKEKMVNCNQSSVFYEKNILGRIQEANRQFGMVVIAAPMYSEETNDEENN